MLEISLIAEPCNLDTWLSHNFIYISFIHLTIRNSFIDPKGVHRYSTVAPEGPIKLQSGIWNKNKYLILLLNEISVSNTNLYPYTNSFNTSKTNDLDLCHQTLSSWEGWGWAQDYGPTCKLSLCAESAQLHICILWNHVVASYCWRWHLQSRWTGVAMERL